MTPKGKMKSYTGCVWSLVLFIALAVMVLMFGSVLSGCKHVEYVTVPEIHEIHHHHTDSIHETDSVTKEKETIIMQLDSATMAKYGIQLKAAERAWLIRTNELERQLQRLSEMHNDTLYVHDSIPYPVEVIKNVEVEKELTWWQKLVMGMGSVLLVLIGGFVAVWLYKLFVKFKPL